MEKNKYPVIILVRPQLPENIGMCARAMMNCGFTDMRIVSPRIEFPNSVAIKSAAHADQIIKNSKVFNNLEQATYDLSFLIATSVRERFANKKHIFDFDDLTNSIPNFRTTGIVFGC